MKINISAGKSSYSQRNNIIKPLESCNVTSMVMALDYLGYPFPRGKHEQPEDNLRAFTGGTGGEPEIDALFQRVRGRYVPPDVAERYANSRSQD